MARGLGGLASGLMAGAQLGMQMADREERQALRAEESALRQRATEIQDAQEARAQESHEASMLRQAAEGKRAEAQESRAQESHAASLAQMESQEARASAQEERLAKNQQWEINKQLKQEKEKNLLAMAPVEFNRVLSGGSFSDEFMDLSSGTQYDPRFMATPEFKDASKVAFETVDSVMTKLKEDPSSLEVSDYNKPNFIGAMNTILAPNINEAVGMKDPNTGKVVESKRIVSILPAPGGKGMVFDVETTLDDGTKYVAPITENRTSDPDDPVKVVPIGELLDTINGSMQMASAFEQDDLKNYMTANFPVGGNVSQSSQETTRRQYLRELSDIDKQEADLITDIKKDQMLTDDEKQTRIIEAQELMKGRRSTINERYGVTSPKEKVEETKVGSDGAGVPTPSGGGETRTNIDIWAEGDSGKRRFMAEAQAYADANETENPFSAYSPSELDEIYREWRNDQEADDIVSGMM